MPKKPKKTTTTKTIKTQTRSLDRAKLDREVERLDAVSRRWVYKMLKRLRKGK